ncbi:MAG: acyltransferase [Erysipelotrichaceae bacterium]|nr:acyltransferase [Erysipelotrichaceae bacterium]
MKLFNIYKNNRKNLFFYLDFLFLLCVCIWLKNINVLQNGFAHPFAILIFSFCGSCFIEYQKQVQAKREKDNQLNYDNLDWLRYISAILVLLLHLRPFQNQIDALDLSINNIIGRICVPLFFLITGYFVAKKQMKQPDYIRHYIRSMLPFYLVWSMLYLPVTIHMFFYQREVIQQFLPVIPLWGWIVLTPVVLIVMLVYAGTYYHLWYFPALFFALWIIDHWQRRFSLNILWVSAFVLLILGASETYYGILSQPIQTFIGYYYRVFITTRNGLFFGLFYVIFGYLIGKKQSLYTKHLPLKLFVCCILLVVEGILLQLIQRLNSNIMLSCIPLSYYLFVTAIYSNSWFRWPFQTSLRDLYKYYYILHPLVIYVCSFFILPIQVEHSVLLSLIVIFFTHLVTLFLLWIKKRCSIAWL